MKLSLLNSVSAVVLCVTLAGCNCGTKKETPAPEATAPAAVEQVKQEVKEGAEVVAPVAPEATAPVAEQAPVEAPAAPAEVPAEAGK